VIAVRVYDAVLNWNWQLIWSTTNFEVCIFGCLVDHSFWEYYVPLNDFKGSLGCSWLIIKFEVEWKVVNGNKKKSRWFNIHVTEWIMILQGFLPFLFEDERDYHNYHVYLTYFFISILEPFIPGQFCQPIACNSLLYEKSRITTIEDSDTFLLSYFVNSDSIKLSKIHNIKKSYQWYYRTWYYQSYQHIISMNWSY
jgi:hypothetical protein